MLSRIMKYLIIGLSLSISTVKIRRHRFSLCFSANSKLVETISVSAIPARNKFSLFNLNSDGILHLWYKYPPIR